MNQGYSPLAKGRALEDNIVKSVAERHGKTASQVLIRWSMQKKIPCIPKSTKIDHVLGNSQVVYK